MDDSEAHLVGDFDSGSCTPPALSSTQSVDTLSIALLKALSDFSSTQDDGPKVPGSPTSASAGPTVRIEGAAGDDQALPPAGADSAKATDQSQRYYHLYLPISYHFYSLYSNTVALIRLV